MDDGEILLVVGPPGTGKTLLAKAIAGEAGVPFFSISGSDFVEMFVGVGAARVRDLFEQAKKEAPSIIFIDELDTFGSREKNGNASIINELLTQLDGFVDNKNPVFIIGILLKRGVSIKMIRSDIKKNSHLGRKGFYGFKLKA